MKLPRFRHLAALLGALAAGTLAFALPSAALAQEKPKVIRIAYSGAGTGGRPITGGTAISTAHQQGVLEKEFAKDGIKIQWTFNPGAGPATNEQLANGLADFAHHGDLPIIIGRSTGLRTKILFSYTRFGSSYITGPIDSPAKSLEDLKGKRLAVFKGTASQLTLGRILKKHGLTERDFKTVSMDGDTLRAAIATKDVDGGFIAPFDLQARGVGKIIYDTGPGSGTDLAGSVLGVRRLRTQVSRDRAARGHDADQGGGMELGRKEQGSPVQAVGQLRHQLLRIQEDLRRDPAQVAAVPLLDDYFVENLKKSIQQAKEFKLIRRDVDIAGWLAPQYLNAALKDLKLEGYWPAFNAAGAPVNGAANPRLTQK
jgi:sulfonate transport system substrate-binding protein